MIPVILYPPPAQWETLLQRPSADNRLLMEQVSAIMAAVRAGGDKTLRDLSAKYEGRAPLSFRPSAEEWASADTVSEALKSAIRTAINNIRKFHSAQIPQEIVVETMPGILCRSRPVAIEKAGLYIPGGTAPLCSTLLMLGIPALLAGCREIVVCTPAGKEGRIAPAILFAARELGIDRLYKAGGAQAIAAMAYGTESIPRVYKIFGPGNTYVTTAKMLLQAEGIAIDMPAGPSELAILADETCVPAFVAADLLSQAEHGADSQVLLVSSSRPVIDEVCRELAIQTESLPRASVIRQSLRHSKAILVSDLREGIRLLNHYAPEHLILACRDSDGVADQVINAGSVFIGNHTPESAGDYASGTNHTLPTNGYARMYSGVSVSSFMKTISFQKISPEGLAAIAPAITGLATEEGLEAHARAVTIRLNSKES